jgi:ubiquinone/menaquinone biosynthesis C-methylase UbiE
MVARLLATQLGNPAGIVGRWLLAPLWNRRNAVLNDVTFDALALRPADRVLEVGFGGGYLLGRMATAVTDGLLAGVDASPAMVDYCQKRYRPLVERGVLELHWAQAESLPYPAEHFGKACSVNSIFYWESAPQALSELGRVLTVGGLLVLCFTCRESIEDKEFARHGLALYTADEVRGMMAGTGFGGIEATQASDRHREFLCLVGRKQA